MRRILTTLAIGFLLYLSPTPASATTPGRVCKQACKPRVLEQCDGLVGPERRRCRRPLIRACKATTPEIGCPTTADLQQELSDRRFRINEAPERDVTLCASGDFSLTDRGDPNAIVSIIDTREGSWTVRLVDGELALVLDDDTPIPLAHDAGGSLLVDGLATALADAEAQCNPPPPPPPVVDDVDQAQLVALVRALADRTIVIDAPDGDPNQQRELRLCSSGRSTDTTSNDAGTIQSAVNGTWTVDGSILQLDESTGSTVPFGIELRDDGTLLVDDEVAQLRDARDECAGAELQARLTTALGGNRLAPPPAVWEHPGPHQARAVRLRALPHRNDVGCGRNLARERDERRRDAEADGDGGGTRDFVAAFDASGEPTVDGTAPIDEESLVSAACQS
jgi:hypothetical protein